MRTNERRPLGTDSIELSGIVSMANFHNDYNFEIVPQLALPAAVELRFRVTLLTTSVPQVVLGITFLFV